MFASQEKNKAVQTSYFDVPGLCCSSEVSLVENILKPLDGVEEVSVIVPSRTLVVVHDSFVISQIEIVKALNRARLEANIRVHGDKKHQKKWPSLYAMASGIFLLLSLLRYVYPPLKYLALGAVVVGGSPMLSKALASIRNLRLDMNVLMSITVIGTIAVNDYLEAGAIVFIFTIAEWLESTASHKASAAMISLMNIAPQKAVMAETGEVVDADKVEMNTTIAIKAGEVIPIDGIVVEGDCEVDEKTLTGESFPVPKHKDSTVWAGTVNLNGYISVKTIALAEDCVVAKMAKLVEEAQKNKTSIERLIDKFAKFYTPPVVFISALIAVIPVVLGVPNRRHWLYFALVVLLSACPCALILSTPVATFCAYTKAATSGLLIKGGEYLETLGTIKIMAFDKTGTITKGEFVVTNFQSLNDDVDSNTLLYWVSSIESKSSHPMAAAIVDYGRSLCIKPKPERVTGFENFPGEGIHGIIDERDVYIGNKKISMRAGSETVPTLHGSNQGGKAVNYVYSGATLIGFFSLSDACRSGVQEAITELQLLGIKTAMLTGDSQAAAMQVQEQIGHALEQVHAELLPDDKEKFITRFKTEGSTAMVGDGVNDAPALATADIGISMGISGSALASETSNIILMSNDITKIPEAIKLARKSHRKVIENVIISVTTKAAILGLAFAGYPIVWAAVLADVGTCLLVILNSMLLLRGGDGPGGHGCDVIHGKSSHHQHQHCCPNKDGSGLLANDGSIVVDMIIHQSVGNAKTDTADEAHRKCKGSDELHQHQHQHCCSNEIKKVSQPEKGASCNCTSKCQSSPINKRMGSDLDIQDRNAGPHSDCKKMHGADYTSVDIISENEHVESAMEEKEEGSCCKGCSSDQSTRFRAWSAFKVWTQGSITGDEDVSTLQCPLLQELHN